MGDILEGRTPFNHHEYVGWQSQSACQPENLDLFFSDSSEDQEEAKTICQECPVQSDCLSYAMTNIIVDGIFGGMDWEDRKRYAAREGLVMQRKAVQVSETEQECVNCGLVFTRSETHPNQRFCGRYCARMERNLMKVRM